MTQSRKTAAWIQNLVREGKKPVVGQKGDSFTNLHVRRAAYLVGDYVVTEKEHEVLVDLNSQRRDRLE